MFLGRILVVEDEEGLRVALVELFQALGYEVVGVPNGLSAIQILGVHPVDLIVVEYHLPMLGGRDILDAIAHSGLDTDVIAVAHQTTIPDVVDAIKSGACSFLMKPLTAEVLKREVKEVFRERFERRTRRDAQHRAVAPTPPVATPAPAAPPPSAPHEASGILPRTPSGSVRPPVSRLVPPSEHEPVTVVSKEEISLEIDIQESLSAIQPLGDGEATPLVDVQPLTRPVQPQATPPSSPLHGVRPPAELRQDMLKAASSIRSAGGFRTPFDRGQHSVDVRPPADSFRQPAQGTPIRSAEPHPERTPSGGVTGGTAMLGRYHLRRMLGKGGMGEVFEAYDPVLEREIAIKVVNVDPGFESRSVVLERFKREASVAARLQHPHIAAIYDIETDSSQQRVYFVMELVKGSTLRSVLQRHKTLSFSRALTMAYKLVDALEYVHSHDVVHRDIKPENIMLSTDDRLKIVDFGIAKVPVSNLTDSRCVVGSPSYLAPESVAGKPVDFRADQFSLATVLVEALSGKSVFSGHSFEETLRNVAVNKPPRLKDLGVRVPTAFEEIVDRMHQRDPEHRFKDEVDLLNRLGAIGERLALRLTSAVPRPTVLGRVSLPPVEVSDVDLNELGLIKVNNDADSRV